MKHIFKSAVLVLHIGALLSAGNSLLGSEETGSLPEKSLFKTIFQSTWQPFNQKYHLFSDTLLTGIYYDTDLINGIAQNIFTLEDSGEIVWNQVDLLQAYVGNYFNVSFQDRDIWRKCSTVQPLKMLAGMLAQSDPDGMALSYVAPRNDSLPAVIIFKGYYNRWYQLFKHHNYALLLAIYHGNDRLTCQYQVLNLSPNLVYNPLAKFPLHVLTDDLFLDDFQPVGKELIKIRQDYVAQTQVERDSLFQWFLNGPHNLETPKYYKPKPGNFMGYPENWRALTDFQRERFIKDALSPEKWHVKAAEVQIRPFFFSYDYKFILESRQDKTEQLSVVFNLFYGSYDRSGNFKAGRMEEKSIQRVEGQ